MSAISPHYKDADTGPSYNDFILLVEENSSLSEHSSRQSHIEPHKARQSKIVPHFQLDRTSLFRATTSKMLRKSCCFCPLVTMVLILVLLSAVGASFLTTSMVLSRSRLSRRDDMQDIAGPIACHSHNDYLRDRPLYDALAAGCTGVEADVWLQGDDLLVAHTENDISSDRTLRSLYLDNLLSMLQDRNPDQTTSFGVFESDPDVTLTLLVDFKTDDPSIYDQVLSQLDPLRSNGWLTFWDGSDTTPGPVTVVATGEASFDQLTANDTYRDIFFDAPLDKLEEGDTKYSTADSYYASVSLNDAVGSLSWLGELSSDQTATIQAQISAANSLGLKSRYWDTPGSPSWMRTHIEEDLEKEGVGMLNVDDVEEGRSIITENQDM